MLSKYYDLSRLLSHNSYISMCMSGRGTGKSFSAKKRAINNYIKRGEQTVYLRRSATEIDRIKDTYFSDIKNFFPELELEVSGYEGYINGELAIYFIPLSTSSTLKSASYPKVTLLIFDEYCITHTTHSRYLKNEMTLFFDIVETIFRDRRKANILILSNSVSFVNPIFSFFDIIPDPNVRFQKFKNNLITLELFTSEEFLKDKLKTPFAQLVSGTNYADYAIGNQTLEDNNDFIEKKPPGNYRFVSSFKRDNFEIGCWYNIDNKKYYLDEKIDTSSNFRFSITVEDVEPNIKLVKQYRATWHVKNVINAYNNYNLYFQTQEIKKFFQLSIIKYI